MPSTALNAAIRAVCLLIAIPCSSGGCGEDTSESLTSSFSMSEDPLSPDDRTGDDRVEPTDDRVEPTDDTICDNLYDPNAIPFATALFPISDACPRPRERVAPLPSSTVTHVRRGPPGEICMSGQVTTGWVNLIMSFDRINAIFGDTPAPDTRQPLNALALGIAALRFTLDPAPANGLHVRLSQVVGENCTATTQDCIQAGFYAMAEGRPGVLVNFDQAGSQTLRIAEFQRAPWIDPTLELDTTQLSGVEFELNAGDFDFCLRDFDLLDDSGNPVAPTQE